MAEQITTVEGLEAELRAYAKDCWRISPCGCGHRADLHTDPQGNVMPSCAGGLVCSCDWSHSRCVRVSIEAILDRFRPDRPVGPSPSEDDYLRSTATNAKRLDEAMGGVHGVTYSDPLATRPVGPSPEANLVEDGRRLASERDDLIASGVDPSSLLVPLAPPVSVGPSADDDLALLQREAKEAADRIHRHSFGAPIEDLRYDLERVTDYVHALEARPSVTVTPEQVEARVLNELADLFERHGVLWYGDGGVTIREDEAQLKAVTIQTWLRERAAALGVPVTKEEEEE